MKTDTTLNNNDINLIKSPTEMTYEDDDPYGLRPYNRKVRRYAEKHKISGAEAFEILYEKRNFGLD